MKSIFSNLTASSRRICARFEAACQGDDQSDLGHLVFALLAEESIGGACLSQLGLTMDVLAEEAFGTQVAQTAQDYLNGNSPNEAMPVLSALEEDNAHKDGLTVTAVPVPDWYMVLRDRAAAIAKRSDDGPAVSSEHLVLAMTEIEGLPQNMLQKNGVFYDDVKTVLQREEGPVERLKVDLILTLDGDHDGVTDSSCDDDGGGDGGGDGDGGDDGGDDGGGDGGDGDSEDDLIANTDHALSVVTSDAEPFDAEPFDAEPSDAERSAAAHSAEPSGLDDRVFALLDANLNRVREGLRVLEDSARFVFCNESTTGLLKELRHWLVEEELGLRARHPLIQRRDVVADAGTQATTDNEKRRIDLRDVLTSNCRRMQEALRSLEEFSKLVDSEFSEACKQIRYQTYEAEQRLDKLLPSPVRLSTPTADCRWRNRNERLRLLKQSSLYVLLTEKLCERPWKHTAEVVLQAGADILQLREKDLSDTELLRRSEWLRDLCLEHDALFIINDNPELASRCDADGVHLGQTDGSVADARKQLDCDQLIGLSTHNLLQLNDAMQQAADYLGVGPMFSTTTKSFESYSGLDYAAQAAQHASIPWFAIGGINDSNLQSLMETGAQRIAVCGTVIGATHPEEIVRDLKQRLTAAGRSS